jgi:hypothetical protein
LSIGYIQRRQPKAIAIFRPQIIERIRPAQRCRDAVAAREKFFGQHASNAGRSAGYKPSRSHGITFIEAVDRRIAVPSQAR